MKRNGWQLTGLNVTFRGPGKGIHRCYTLDTSQEGADEWKEGFEYSGRLTEARYPSGPEFAAWLAGTEMPAGVIAPEYSREHFRAVEAADPHIGRRYLTEPNVILDSPPEYSPDEDPPASWCGYDDDPDSYEPSDRRGDARYLD